MGLGPLGHIFHDKKQQYRPKHPRPRKSVWKGEERRAEGEKPLRCERGEKLRSPTTIITACENSNFVARICSHNCKQMMFPNWLLAWLVMNHVAASKPVLASKPKPRLLNPIGFIKLRLNCMREAVHLMSNYKDLSLATSINFSTKLLLPCSSKQETSSFSIVKTQTSKTLAIFS